MPLQSAEQGGAYQGLTPDYRAARSAYVQAMDESTVLQEGDLSLSELLCENSEAEPGLTHKVMDQLDLSLFSGQQQQRSASTQQPAEQGSTYTGRMSDYLAAEIADVQAPDKGREILEEMDESLIEFPGENSEVDPMC